MNLILIQASESWGEDYPYPTLHWFSAHQHWRGQKSSAGTVQLGHRGRWPWGASKVGLRRWLYHLFLPSVCVHAKLLQSCPTLCYPMDCSMLGSSVYGILQARILEWVAISFSGVLPSPEREPGSPALQADSLPPSHQESLHWYG
jgi:hypothetical protein